MTSAPLTATDDAPVPRGAAAEWLVRPDGARLRVARFAPAGRARGSVVLSGGRTEPIEKYFEVIEELLARGFAVVAHDWRGQGLSDRALADRLVGHGGSHQELVADLFAVIDHHHAHLPPPRLAIGHSLGGCVTLLALATAGSGRFAASVLSAPMLGLDTGALPWRLVRSVARMHRLLGRGERRLPGGARAPFDDTFEGNVLTHDRVRFARHRGQIAACRDLELGEPTWGWLDAAFQGMALLAHPRRLERVTIPVVICAAQLDRVVDNAALRRAARMLPRGRLVEVPGSHHEILMETDERRAFFWWAFDELVAAL